MSKWDDLDHGAGWQVKIGRKDNAEGSPVFMPSDVKGLSVLFCGEAPKSSSIADIHDAARFAEDFVLCDHIGVPSRMFHYVGPHLVNLRKWEDFPLLDFHGVTYEFFNAGHNYRETADELLSNAKGGSVEELLESDQERLVNSLARAVTLLKAFSMLDDIGELTGTSTEDWNALAGIVSANADHSFSSLSGLFRWAGLSASPGWRYRDEFAMQQLFPERFFYDAVAERFKTDATSIQAWEETQQILVPPIMALLVARAGSPKFLLQELVVLREEFAEVRAVGRRYRAALAAANSMREKLKIIQEMENAREALVRKLSAATRPSIVQRLWNIVKGLTVSSVLVRFADLLLEWDQERYALSSVRAFGDIHHLSLDIRHRPEQFTRIFGEIVP